jgi:hypothetical protein
LRAEVFLKRENFQRMGPFTFRGAFNALSKFNERQRPHRRHGRVDAVSCRNQREQLHPRRSIGGSAMIHMPLLMLIAAAVMVLLPPMSRAEPAPVYRITIPPIVDGDVKEAFGVAITNAEIIAGTARVNEPDKRFKRLRAFRWSQAGGLEIAPEGAASRTLAVGLDGPGRVFADADRPRAASRAMVWNTLGGYRALVREPSGISTKVESVSARGDAVGIRFDRFPNTPTQQMFWPREGEAVDFAGLTSYEITLSDLNPAQRVVGTINGVGGVTAQAFIWSAADGFQYLGLIPGGNGTGITTGLRINDVGSVIGKATLSDRSPIILYLWTRFDGFRPIDPPSGCDLTNVAVDLNNRGWVVGNCYDFSSPFLWTPESGLARIDDLIDPADPLRDEIDIYSITAINDNGSLVGTATQLRPRLRSVPVILRLAAPARGIREASTSRTLSKLE